MEEAKMRILVGCEKSRRIAKAFEDKGHDATSCDILPAEQPGKHIQDDVMKHLNDGWDMAIFHPDCTYLANSGVRWLHERPERWEKMRSAALFFRILLECGIPRIAIENPIPHKYALKIIGRKYDEIIQPWWFGEGETKATCLWLINLPLLMATIVHAGRYGRVFREPPGDERKANRSRTYQGIADAMATQWNIP
jgi:hypothetical protein